AALPDASGEVAAVVHRRTGGNPYRLVELLAAGDGAAARPAVLDAARDHLAAGLPEATLRAVAVGLAAAGDELPLLRLGTAAAVAAARDAEAAGYAARWLALVPPEDLLDRAAAHRELATACGR